MTEKILSDLYFTEGKINHFAPCLAFTLDFDVPAYTDVLDFYERCYEQFKDNFKYYSTGGKLKRTTPKTSELISKWMAMPLKDILKSYYIKFYSEEEGAGEFDLMIYMRYENYPSTEQIENRRKTWETLLSRSPVETLPYPGSRLRLSIPLNHELANPKKLIEWIRNFDILQNGNFIAGHLGYEININEQFHSRLTENKLVTLSSKYPGLGWAINQSVRQWNLQKKDIFPVIKRINWLNFFSEEIINRLDDKEELLNCSLKFPAIKQNTIGKSQMMQIGEAPDLFGKKHLTEYNYLAKIIEPLQGRLSTIKSQPILEIDNYDWLQNWLKYYNKQAE